MLKVETERAGDVVVIKCAGRIVRGQEAALEDAVLGERPARILVLDLSDVEMIDAGGLNLLLSLHGWAVSTRTHLKLVNPRPFVQEMLARTHLDSVFDISSLDHALAVLASGEYRLRPATAY
jgi:anti-anti-sigma factor